MNDTRELIDLVSVGPATVRDFHELGIRAVDDLKGRNADDLYKRLNKLKGQKVDICCKDVFEAAIAQANDPKLPKHKRQWWYWSKVRKAKRSSG